MFFSGLILAGAIPFFTSLLFYPSQLFDAHKLTLHLPFMEWFVFAGVVFSLIFLIATIVCGLGALVDRGPKKIKITSITPHVVAVSVLLVALFPFVFPKPAASAAAIAALMWAQVPKPLSGGVVHCLMDFAQSRDPKNLEILDNGLDASSRMREYSRQLHFCDAMLNIPSLEKWRICSLTERKAYAFESLRDFNNAITEYSKTISMSSNNFSNYESRARCLIAMKRFDEALTDCTKMIDISAVAHLPYHLQVMAYLGKGSPDQAMKSIDKAIALDDGKTPQSFLFKWYLLNQKGDLVESHQVLLKASDCKLNEFAGPATRALKAFALYKTGKKNEALKQLKEVCADNGESILEYNLGSLAWYPKPLQDQFREFLATGGVHPSENWEPDDSRYVVPILTGAY